MEVCPKCEKGAILVEDLKVPAAVESIKVVSGKKVLALYVSKAALDNTCPYCGMPIKTVTLEKPAKKPEKKPEEPPKEEKPGKSEKEEKPKEPEVIVKPAGPIFPID